MLSTRLWRAQSDEPDSEPITAYLKKVDLEAVAHRQVGQRLAEYTIMSTPGRIQLVGAKHFVRNNPRTDRFPIHRFHHIEFWCSDATTTYKRYVGAATARTHAHTQLPLALQP